MINKKRVAVLISGNGSNLQALIDAAQSADYPAQIALVIANRADAYGLTRAEQAGINTQCIDYTAYKSRADFDAAMHEQLIAHTIEIVCLAGFMRLLTPEFVQKWQGRILNIHPSLLPEFKGAYAVRDALAAGVQQTGCSVHHVVPEMDAGKVIMQAKVLILPNDTEATLRERIHAQEHTVYPKALKMLIANLNARGSASQ